MRGGFKNRENQKSPPQKRQEPEKSPQNTRKITPKNPKEHPKNPKEHPKNRKIAPKTRKKRPEKPKNRQKTPPNNPEGRKKDGKNCRPFSFYTANCEQTVNERNFQIFSEKTEKCEKMKIIFTFPLGRSCSHKIFKIFNRTLVCTKKQKIYPNVLTIGYFYAKIGIVKGFFTKNENNFQKYRKFSSKVTEK